MSKLKLYVVVKAYDETSHILFIGDENAVRNYGKWHKFYQPDYEVMNYIMPKFFIGCIKKNVVHVDWKKKLIVERVL